MSVRRSLLVLTLVMVLLPIIVISIDSQQARQELELNRNKLSNLETHIVQRGRVESIVTALGSIEADRSLGVSFQIPGRIETIFVSEGDFIFMGEPLIQLDNASQRIAYEQAVLARERSEIEFADIQAPVTDEEIQLAQVAVDSAWGRYLSIENSVSDDDIRAAELAYQQALDAYNQVREQRDQAPGGYGSDAYVALDAQTGAASFNAEIARLQLEDLKSAVSPSLNAAYAQVVLAQREYDRTLAGPTDFEVESSALQVRQAEAQLRRAETSLNRTTLSAPIDGVVTAINTEVGGLISPGLVVVEITDRSPLRLSVMVDEIDVRLIEVGMNARVELDALPDVSIPALVESIALLGDSSSGVVSYEVNLTVDETLDPRIRIGMTAETSIIVDVRDDVIIVPNYYIRREEDRFYVNRLIDNQLIETEIVLGLQGRDISEVVVGLESDDVIAVDFSEDRFSIFGD